MSAHASLVSKLEDAAASLADATRLAAELQPGRRGSIRVAAESRLREVVRSLISAARSVEALQDAVRQDADEKLAAHDALDSKLSESLALLAAASTMAEKLHGGVRTGAAAEIGAERRLRLRDVVRTVNAARHHISRVQVMSSSLSRALREYVEEATGDLWSAFE